VTEAERNRVVDLLRAHAVEGTLTPDDFSERVGAALVAHSPSDLAVAYTGLPALRQDAAPGLVTDARTPGRVRRWVVAVMSGNHRRGRWRTGGQITVVAVMGSCELDFRQAEFETEEVMVTAVAFWGGVDIIVPEGYVVELTGLPIMGGKHIKLADVPILPGSPRILVRGFPIMGGVNVRSRPAVGSSADRLEAGEPSLPTSPTPPAVPAAQAPAAQAPAAQAPAAQAPAAQGPAQGLAASAPTVGQAEHRTVTLLFADMCSYTELTERLGDLQSYELVNIFHGIVRDKVALCGGSEFKAQGDGFMMAFTGANQAIGCAVAIANAVEEHSRRHPERAITIHQGLHAGDTLSENGDFMGRTVNLASRIAGAACESEILVSSLVRELAGGARTVSFGEARQVELKGITGAQTLYPVQWRHSSAPAQ
jgi:class 3 adenylate cyclase